MHHWNGTLVFQFGNMGCIASVLFCCMLTQWSILPILRVDDGLTQPIRRLLMYHYVCVVCPCEKGNIANLRDNPRFRDTIADTRAIAIIRPQPPTTTFCGLCSIVSKLLQQGSRQMDPATEWRPVPTAKDSQHFDILRPPSREIT